MSPPLGNSEFCTTNWSLVVAAANQASETSHAALSDLCQAYWYPLYAFLRRRDHDVEEARDLTQGFFAALLERGYLLDADPERGRFRSFLLIAIARFAAKEHDRKAAKKRGGGKTPLSIDFQEGENRYQREPIDHWTPERIFERRWALTLLERTLGNLRQEYASANHHELFEALKVFLTGESGAPRVRQVAEGLGMSEGAVKVAIHRLRQKYRELLRAEVSQTVAAQEDVEGELAELLTALRGTS